MTTHERSVDHARPAAEFAGLQREFEIGLALSPTASGLPAAAKSLAALLDEAGSVPVRLAGVDASGSRAQVIIAVTLGSVDEIKVAGQPAREAVLLLQRIIDEFAPFDPSFILLPEPDSAAARAADRLVSGLASKGSVGLVQQLLTIG